MISNEVQIGDRSSENQIDLGFLFKDMTRHSRLVGSLAQFTPGELGFPIRRVSFRHEFQLFPFTQTWGPWVRGARELGTRPGRLRV